MNISTKNITTQKINLIKNFHIANKILKKSTLINISRMYSNNGNTNELLKNTKENSKIKIFPKDEIINSKKQIELLKNNLAVMDRPFNWEEMKYLIDSDSVEVFSRTYSDEIVYKNWMKVLKEKYNSINDYIKITVMGYSEKIDKESGLIAAYKPSDKVKEDNEKIYTVFRRNDFPYWLEPNISHYLLWSLQELSNGYAKKLIQEKFPNEEYEFLYFTNPPDKKSVKGVPHYQIFSRPKILNNKSSVDKNVN